jgi:hypothetical protein
MRLAIAAFLLLLVKPAWAEECQKGWVASLDVPKDGATARPGSHFRVLLYWGCSDIDGGPRPELRLRSGDGAEIPFTQVAWSDHYVELFPKEPKADVTIELQVRRPASKDALGPWERLARVTIAGTADAVAPELEGLTDGEAAAVEGTVALSPCHSVPGWELETRLTFPAARDAGSQHDELLYVLERAPAGESRWEARQTLRPTPQGDGMTFTWRDDRGWDEEWVYRLSVRDMAGNQTAGLRTISIKNPTRPARELRDPNDWPSASPASSEVPPLQGRCVCRSSLLGVDQGGAGAIALFVSTLTAGAPVLRYRRRRRPESSIP